MSPPFARCDLPGSPVTDSRGNLRSRPGEAYRSTRREGWYGRRRCVATIRGDADGECDRVVDDAVLGRLPGICAQDGVATTSRFRIVEEIGRSNRVGTLWFLLLVGPLGWMAFLLVAPRSSGEELAVEVPYSEPAYERFVQVRRLRNGAMAGEAAAVIGLLFLTAWARLEEAGVLLVLAALVVATVTVLVGEWRMRSNLVGVSLDASRRWVTLTNVHPAFASACRDRREHQHQR